MASLGVKIFSVLIYVGAISSGSGAEIPDTSFGTDLPKGCVWQDTSCQADTQDTIIPKANGFKALCCSKDLFKDEEDEVSDRSTHSGCRWIGTAPFCMADKCRSNEHITQTSEGGDGHDCLTGHKTLCCPNTKTHFMNPPYPDNGNTDEKLSKNVDVKYFNKLNRNLGETWNKGGQRISFTGSDLSLKDRNTLIPDIETVFMSHGYQSKATGDDGCEAFVKAYNKAGRDVQVICIDWRNLASLGPTEVLHYGGLYNGEAMNSVDVGWWLGRLLHSLVKKTGLDSNKVHLIGHSLGSHVVGTMGRTFTALSGEKVARITGLDPAGPLFVRNGYGLKKHMINKDDGAFVDIIHTNGDFDPLAFDLFHLKDSLFMGDLHQLGHVDFYPNGGRRQGASGCMPSFGFCSHMRSIVYYLHSIDDPAQYAAYPCASATTCSQGKKTGKTVANHMGESAKQPAKGTRELYYLDIKTDYGWL